MATAKGTDSVLVKKPHTRESFTEEQLRENYDKFIALIYANFKEDRLKNLLNLHPTSSFLLNFLKLMIIFKLQKFCFFIKRI